MTKVSETAAIKKQRRVLKRRASAGTFVETLDGEKYQAERILGLLLAGTALCFLLLLSALLFSFFVAGNTYVLGRIIICTGLLCFVGGLTLLWRVCGWYRLVSILLVSSYAVVVVFAMALWGISTPFPLLLASFVVVLAGILLGARVTLLAAAGVSMGMLTLQILIDHNLLHPTPQVLYPSRYGDVLGFGVILGIIALVSWLSAWKMEQTLSRALAAEQELQKEKALLARRLEERTRTLQETQLQEMQQLYRFAELGQLSTALLHDLSNHLTVLTLDIDDIDKKQHSSAIKRAKHTMVYLDKIVEKVKLRLQESGHLEVLNVYSAVQEVVTQLKPRANRQRVTIQIQANQEAERAVLLGGPIRLNQILAIIFTNAIDAYEAYESAEPRKVMITLRVQNRDLVISIKDWGKGVADSDRHRLFKPFYSTKEGGMGIGLFIARQMLQDHLHGSISITPGQTPTEFIISLPVKSVS